MPASFYDLVEIALFPFLPLAQSKPIYLHCKGNFKHHIDYSQPIYYSLLMGKKP
jgi:hypothetical protein